MTDEEVIQLLSDEFQLKTLAATDQYLEIHQPVFEGGVLKVSRIDRERTGQIIVYLPVKNEYFLFAVYIDAAKKKIDNVGTESRNIVSLIATSDSMTVDEMLSLTKLKATESWNKGDYKKNGKATYNVSGVGFEPDTEPDEFEDKLKRLLLHLNADREGVRQLVSQANTNIRVLMDFHSGNQHLGGPIIDLESIRIMNDLNLSIEFDLWAWGNPFR